MKRNWQNREIKQRELRNDLPSCNTEGIVPIDQFIYQKPVRHLLCARGNQVDILWPQGAYVLWGGKYDTEIYYISNMTLK